MVQKDITINQSDWVKAKSSAEFIQRASNYKASIWVEKDGKKANAKSLLGLLALGVAPGCSVRLIADGEDEGEAIAELDRFLSQNV